MAFAVKMTVKKDTRKALTAEMQKRMRNEAPALRDIGLVMLESVATNFERGGRPRKWKRSFNSKITGKKTLQDTGILKGSVVYNVKDKNKLLIGSNKKYARIHQEGGVIRARKAPFLTFKLADGTFRRVKRVKIPKREFVLFQKQDIQIAEKIIFDYSAVK